MPDDAAERWELLRVRLVMVALELRWILHQAPGREEVTGLAVEARARAREELAPVDLGLRMLRRRLGEPEPGEGRDGG